MIKYLAKLMHELQKQGYDWKNLIEAKPDVVRVRYGEIEVSLYVVNETGKLTEVKPVIRETIEQVVDYILE